MITKSLTSSSPEETPRIAREILAACENDKVFAIYGDLGAGKTTLVRSICEELLTEDIVKSPTFAIVNEYESPRGPVYHFDFYRISRLEEAYDLGYEEYFYSGNYCFIEWPERVEELIPRDAVKIRIEAPDQNNRVFTLSRDY